MLKIFNNKEVEGLRKQLRRNQTLAEQMLWSALRGKQLNGYRFRRQYSVGKFVLDFYCPELKLAIEVDGDSHASLEGVERDTERTAYIQEFGIRIFRVLNQDVYDRFAQTVESIKLELVPSRTLPLSEGEPEGVGGR